MDKIGALNIGTCSWKYDSWQGLIYPTSNTLNHLLEYSKSFQTVEVDQWFWSLFQGNKVLLPKRAVVEEYAASVPDNFVFAIKVPNAITLTHHYNKKKDTPLIANPYFLSIKILEKFLDILSPLREKIGPLIFQFEYLNKQKIDGINDFLSKLSTFTKQLPSGYSYCIETRNPNFLQRKYFDFLATHKLSHVFLQGYYMPPIFDVYKKHKTQLRDRAVIRLHGPDRKGIEKVTGKNWDRIVAPKDNDLQRLVLMLNDMATQNLQTFVYVNNHYEGSAPRTISRIDNISHQNVNEV